ncbi:acyl-CoA dehydrogenase family protein [Micromonospora musae]|uniref:Acyl-CoA dehydrogenase n=1 Tax=Micromonospora musae TaxID=1894970 RepID=A0A3A9Y911_9ACTN|nr:acyl-CoA dehydrogenase family protein [Micromonospora musae]RKN33975.1 acyl-CoA dehydrogenase [Micromonospora musae]
MGHHESLSRIIEEIVVPQAAEVDRSAAFPRKAVDALADAGLLALTVPSEHGGGGQDLRAATDVIRQLSTACGSTAMVTLMHYSAVAALTAADSGDVLREIAAGRHLSTLAFSEAGSRSHFWAPVSTATDEGGQVRLDARKSWVTSAGEADSYVWSSRPLTAAGPMSLWLVEAGSPGLSIGPEFDGLGLRGNDSRPVAADGLLVPASARLGPDGAGLDLALTAVLPCFLLLNAAASIGLMQAVTRETAEHLTRTRLQHLNRSLAGQPESRAILARMRIETDRTAALLDATLAALAEGREDAQLLVLEIKAAADGGAAEVADLAMTACGGAAFRKELGIERRFRDSRAARVMAPTTPALLDFVGRALCGLPLLDGADA